MTALRSQPAPHPRTLLGAARMTLAPTEGLESLHLKATAACWLGYHAYARSLWEKLAHAGDAEAMCQLEHLAAIGLAEPRSASRAQT